MRGLLSRNWTSIPWVTAKYSKPLNYEKCSDQESNLDLTGFNRVFWTIELSGLETSGIEPESLTCKVKILPLKYVPFLFLWRNPESNRNLSTADRVFYLWTIPPSFVENRTLIYWFATSYPSFGRRKNSPNENRTHVSCSTNRCSDHWTMEDSLTGSWTQDDLLTTSYFTVKLWETFTMRLTLIADL